MFRTVPLAALLAAMLAVPAAAVPIDTFETDPFSKTLTAPATSFLYISVNAPGHCIAGTRLVILSYGGSGTMSADLTLGDPDDAVDMVFPNGTSSIQYRYEGGPWDLTASGASQLLVVHTEDAGPPGGQVQAWLTDSDGHQATAVLAGGPTVYEFPFSSFAGVDPTKVTQVDVYFHSTSAGNWSVSDIRTAPAPWAQIDWDALREYIEICPVCPPDPCTFDWDILTNPVLPVMGPEILATVQAAGLETVRFNESDSGGDLGIGGPAAMMNMMWMSSSPFTKATLSFDVTFPASMDFSPAMSGPPGLMVPPDPIMPGATTGFALTAPLVVTDDAGRIAGSTVQRMLVFSAAGQELMFDNVTVAQTFARAAGAGYRVTFDVEAVAVDEAEPLLEVYLTGDWSAGTHPTDALSVATTPEGGPGLRALPTISRDVTVLELARPAAAAGTIEIYDVRGRRTRSLPMAAGALSTGWDGRDDAGVPVAAGVYLARWSGAGAAERAAARVIRLR